ncbi:MAG: FAD-binding protein [Cyanobacteria bacterium P01_F01_bin.143]
MQTDYLYSWLKIHKSRPAYKAYPKSLSELQSLLQELKSQGQPYNFVGSSHSYNAIQCLDDNVAIIFDGSGLKSIKYDYLTQEVTVESGVTIEELKLFLRPLGRQLLTSGNYMKQRVIGALVTGTHGYGDQDAIMADSITAVKLLNEDGEIVEITEKNDKETLKYLRVSFGYLGAIISITLKTKPNEQYQVTQKLLTLSDLQSTLDDIAEKPHALTMFPYSDAEDPYIGLIFLEKLDDYLTPKEVSIGTPIIGSISWALIKTFWAIDARFPVIRPFVQRLIGIFAQRREAEIIITSPDDLDYLYDYHPMLESERNPSIIKKLFTTTFTAYNIAVFVPKNELAELFSFLHSLGKRLKEERPRQYFKNSIGARYVGKSTKSAMAGNFDIESYSVDIFFSTTDLELAEVVQDEIAKQFTVRPHWGKSILKSYLLENFPPQVLENFKQKRQEYYSSELLRPNLDQLGSKL